MNTRLTAIFAVLLIAIFGGCASSESVEIALRVTALEYALDHEFAESHTLDEYLLVVSVDEFEDEVLASLASRYKTVSSDTISREEYSPLKPSSHEFIDRDSGKRVVYWSIEIRRDKYDGMVWADVGCMRGPLNGDGQILVMVRSWGRWAVKSASQSWVS